MKSTHQPLFVDSGEVEGKICTLASFERVIGKTMAQHYLQREKFPFVLLSTESSLRKYLYYTILH